MMKRMDHESMRAFLGAVTARMCSDSLSLASDARVRDAVRAVLSAGEVGVAPEPHTPGVLQETLFALASKDAGVWAFLEAMARLDQITGEYVDEQIRGAS